MLNDTEEEIMIDYLEKNYKTAFELLENEQKIDLLTASNTQLKEDLLGLVSEKIELQKKYYELLCIIDSIENNICLECKKKNLNYKMSNVKETESL